MFSADLSQDYSPDRLTVPEINEIIVPALSVEAQHSLSLHTATTNNNDDYNSSSHSIDEHYRSMSIQLENLRKDLNDIDLATFTNLQKFADAVTIDKSLEDLRANTRSHAFRFELKNQLQSTICELSKFVIQLKLQISKLSTIFSDRVHDDTGFNDRGVFEDRPDLPDQSKSNAFDQSKSNAFQNFRHIYEGLRPTTKRCLLCFALIPENEVVKKRFFVYWWVGEGFIKLGSVEKTLEEMGDEIFEDLVKTGCVEAVKKEHRKVADRYKMNPSIRSAVIEIAKEEGFFDFDENGNPTAAYYKCYRACLVAWGNYQNFFTVKANQLTGAWEHKFLDTLNLAELPEKLQTIFNVSESFLDFPNLELFSKFKNVKVLYLGRWQNSPKHHVEVKSIELLKGLSSMKFLRFLSLRGIVNIRELPDSVCQLSSLIILDLRDCLDLEVLPDGIGSLKNLTHLDISECYFLDFMPKGIALLSELVVLKGFAVGQRKSACTVGDLSGLRKLRKLSIYTKSRDFPGVEELNSLQRFEKLQKLTILWRGVAQAISSFEDQPPAWPSSLRAGTKPHFTPKLLKADTFRHGPRPKIPEAFKELEKLDLQCYPFESAPSWLIPDKLAKLKKLYIRGGKLQNLGQLKENDKWKVEILRLKFLSKLKMDLSVLQASFPHLIYFEKFECPELPQFQCDENGLWLKP